MKRDRSVKDPLARNNWPERKKHSGLKRNLIDAERERHDEFDLRDWKKRHVELDKDIKLDH